MNCFGIFHGNNFCSTVKYFIPEFLNSISYLVNLTDMKMLTHVHISQECLRYFFITASIYFTEILLRSNLHEQEDSSLETVKVFLLDSCKNNEK